MAKGILLVQTAANSTAEEHEYDHWYNEVHLPQLLTIAGFVAARRYRKVDTPMPPGVESKYPWYDNVAIYDVEADDITDAMHNLNAMVERGAIDMSPALQMDPLPPTQLYELVVEQRSVGAEG
jgi:hypothetical protein